MKKYAISIDISPTEQIVEDDNQIFCMGVLFSLRSEKSFNKVGSEFPDELRRLTLRKYAGSNPRYRSSLKEHLRYIKESNHVLASVSVVNQRFIKQIGLTVWEKAHGNLPAPFDHNKKGKPRYRLGGYKKQNGTIVEPYSNFSSIEVHL